LGTTDFFQIIMRLTEKFPQPFPASHGPGEIQFMENRVLFFLVKDGDVGEGLFVNIHLKENNKIQETRSK
jgi:hypothetical protein